ncbi:MAG: phosphatase domain-containing protein [Rhodospirillaceae bacterium]
MKLAARPVRTARGHHGVVMQPYRGYGSQSEIFLIGRIFRQSTPPSASAPRSGWRHLRDLGRRVARRGLGGAVVRARFGESEQTVETDADGYFRVHLHLDTPPEQGRLWHWVDLTLTGPQEVTSRGHVFIPPRDARFVVISDIDDTVVFTGVANWVAMVWRLFVQGAGSRVAFPGVAAFYRALYRGVSGGEHNPMLYVSRGPWGIYDILDEFFRLHRIPEGPVVFLREWGLSWTRPLPRKATDHKRILIDNMLTLYRDLPFVLIGDSGQHDPEVYRDIVAQHGDRVLAVYIRNVSGWGSRAAEIEALAKPVVEAGSAFVLAAETLAMVEHAAALGLVGPEAVAEVRGETRADTQGPVQHHPVRTAAPDEVPDMAAEADSPSIVVEPKRSRAQR